MGRNKKRTSRPGDSAAKIVTPKTATPSPPPTPPPPPPTRTQQNSGDITELAAEGDVQKYFELQSGTPSFMDDLRMDDHVLPKEENEVQPDASPEKLDILGNGLITKQVITKGLGRETRPNHGDMVTVSYKCWLDEDEADKNLVEDVSQLTFTVGDGDVIHAFDLAVPLAELKETFELVVDARFAYGARGREPDIPGNARLRYHIELLSCDDPPQYATMSGRERITAANQKREKGNYYYRRDEYAFAVNSYNKALKILSHPTDNDVETPESGEPEDCSDEVDRLTLILHNNLAATQLKIQAFDAAVKSCDMVLRKDPQNFKALFRKGKALIGNGNVDEAIPLLKHVLELVPHSPLVAQELHRAREIQQKEREHWSRAASRMFPHRKHLSTDQKSRSTRSSRLRSVLCSRWVLISSALLFALISIVVAFYTEQLQALPFPWPRTEST